MAIPQEFTDKYFYHFTHIKNLESILKNGFLSTNEKDRLGIGHEDVANGNIQETRHNMNVPINPGGTVHDYVPFYFCTRNPMLLSLVLSKNIDQMFMIFFAVPIDKILDPNVIFTDKAANTSIPPNFYTNPNDLDKLKWDVITSPNWMPKTDTEKRQKMAETLVYKSMPITDVDSIVVWSEPIKKMVKKLFEDNNIKCPNVIYEPFKMKNYFYFTKFKMGRASDTFTTGPILLKNHLKNSIKKIQEKDNGIFRFESIKKLLEEIDTDFCSVEELRGIYQLETINDIHSQNVSDHTLKVVDNLINSDYYKDSNDEDKVILKLSAYFHDIGKGPHEKWPDRKQPSYSDHPVDSLEMLNRILIEEVKELSAYQIGMICLLVAYHDLIGEIFGKGRDKKQLFNLLKDEKEFDMLNCLSYADVLSFNNGWYIDYNVLIPNLKKEFLKQLDK